MCSFDLSGGGACLAANSLVPAGDLREQSAGYVGGLFTGEDDGRVELQACGRGVSTAFENEAIATVENEATQTDWMGDLGGGLGVD